MVPNIRGLGYNLLTETIGTLILTIPRPVVGERFAAIA